MKLKNFIFLIFIFSIVLVNLYSSVIAQENTENTINLLGFELEKILNLISAIIAFILFIISFISYKRDGRKRLLYVSLAFFIFSIKGFLSSSELFIPEIEWIDPIYPVLELIVLLFFFFGVIKKGS